MGLQVKVDSQAETELDEAVSWYEKQKTGLGLSFLDQFFDTMGQVSERPEMFEIAYRSFRRALIKHFPFAVFYTIDKARNQIVVLSVWHTSQNPKKLKKKLK